MSEGPGFGGVIHKDIHYTVSVGVDFGTHGTAIASKLNASDNIFSEIRFGVVNQSETNLKTPTSILLDEEYIITHFGAAAVDEYFQHDEEKREDFYFCEKFKMALFDGATDESESMLRDMVEADNGAEVPTTIVLEQSLKYVFDFVMNSSQLSQNPIWTENALDFSPKVIQWVLTVPAIWTEKAKKKMREAARNAGMTPNGPSQLLIAREPECASIVVHDMIPPGATYILVDAGGGTIDIACHKKVESGVVEVFPPTGGPWGSTIIDDRFGEMLCQCFGEDVIEEFKSDEIYRSGWVEQMHNFAKAKEKFAGKAKNITMGEIFLEHIMASVDDDFEQYKEKISSFEYYGVRGLSVKAKRRNLLYMSAELWELLFSVVLDPICNHISHLLDEPSLQNCTQIVLVGGFGGSERLYTALKEMIHERDRLVGRDGESVVVYQATKPSLCVVQGAARYPSVKDQFVRVAARTYGVESLAKWVAGRHPDDEWKVDYNGVMRYRKGFRKFVTIGDELRDDHKVEHRFRPAASSGVSVNIYSSTEEDPTTTLNARLIGKTFVDFADLPEERRALDQILTIHFHFGSSEITAELAFADGFSMRLNSDFQDLSFAAEVSKRYQA